MILITIIGVLVGGSAIYVGYTYKRPRINSGIFENTSTAPMSSRELLDDIGVSRHRNGGTRTKRKSNHNSRKK